MDIGRPYRELGTIPIEPILSLVKGLSEADWQANPLRQDLFADGIHSATQAIIFKHEWHPTNNAVQYRHIEDLIAGWGLKRGVDPTPFMPRERQDTDLGSVYTFREWFEWRGLLEPLVDRIVEPIRTETGVITRVTLVRLAPGGKILPHVDGQPMAARAHRLHIPIIAPLGVQYRVGDARFIMKPGRVYDFNNRWRHSVRHKGRQHRVNLFVDYYPNPGPVIRPFPDLGPVFARTAARVVS